MIPEGKCTTRMIEVENQSPVSSPEHPSYRVDNHAGTSAPCNSNNVNMQMYIGLPSSDSPTKSVLTSAPTDTVTPKDQQFIVPGLFDKVVVQTDLHKLVNATVNESATILFEGQGELVPNPQVPDNDIMAGHIKLEDFCCLLSSSSLSDSSGLAKSFTSPSTPNTSTDQKI